MKRYRNHEGYADPTAGQAIENILREERRKKQLGEHRASPPRYINKPKNRRRGQ